VDNPLRVHVIVDLGLISTVNIFPSSASVGVQFALFASNTAEVKRASRVDVMGALKVPPAASIPSEKEPRPLKVALAPVILPLPSITVL